MCVMPDPDAPPASYLREIEAGYAEAKAAFASGHPNPYELLD